MHKICQFIIRIFVANEVDGTLVPEFKLWYQGRQTDNSSETNPAVESNQVVCRICVEHYSSGEIIFVGI